MKRSIALLLVLVLIVGALAGCGEKKESGGIKSITMIDDEWQGLDLYQCSFAAAGQSFIADPLIIVNDEGEYVPCVCESYKIAEDGSSITFTIPKDFKWADGTVLTPEDVKRSIEWGLEVSPWNEDYSNITEIKIDGQDVICYLDGYNPATIYELGDIFCPILQAKQINEMSPEELLFGAVPYGAYYVDEFVEGSHATLKRNPNYKTNNTGVKNKGAANVETITVKFIEDPFAVANSIKNGECDITWLDSPDQVEELMALEDYTVTMSPGQTIALAYMNTSFGPMSDPNVRKAIVRAIDRARFATLTGGFISEAYLYSPTFAIDFSQEASDYCKKNYGYDPDAVKELLTASGWKDTDGDGYYDKNGEKLTVEIKCSGGMEFVANFIQIMLKEQGIDIAITVVESTRQYITDDDYEIALGTFGWADTAGTIPYMVRDTNMTELDQDAYFDLVGRGCNETDDAKRLELFTQAQIMLLDSLTVMPYAVANAILVTKNGVFSPDLIDSRGHIKITDVK